MADHLSKEKRSWNMSRIRGRDTMPEKTVRSLLHRRGYRFRLHRQDLPGKPDIVLPRYRTVIFVHGCFWHRHAGCKGCTTPGTHTAFWQAKFARTMERDREHESALRRQGWNVMTVWECETADRQQLGERLERELCGWQDLEGDVWRDLLAAETSGKYGD
jgi:DNA mismatch endonuclease (patch repair protein)